MSPVVSEEDLDLDLDLDFLLLEFLLNIVSASVSDHISEVILRLRSESDDAVMNSCLS